MFVSRAIFALVIVSWSEKAVAECNLNSTFSFLNFLHSQQWSITDTQEITTPEGPGTISEYETIYDLQRIDEHYCASTYCLSTVSVSSPSLHRMVYFFNWGGSAFPDVTEISIAFENKLSNEVCLVHHSGGDMFRENALIIIEGD